MNRRSFFKKGLGAVAAVGASSMLGGYERLLAFPPAGYDLVAVKGGMPDVMFNQGIAALGGMAAFVKKGQKVVIKPNIGWDRSPEEAANTNPKLVARIIEHCFDAGAKEVTVLDHTCDQWEACYKNSGIERAVKDAKGKIVPAHSEGYYHEVAVPAGKSLKKAAEHEAILAADVFINVPVLKDHGSASITAAMKNLMGNVWDRRFWHRTDLHQCIADFATYRKPTLNVIDAYRVMKANGPRGVSVSDVVEMKALLLSTDMVAIDAAATKLWGANPDDIRYIKIGAEMKIGRSDLDKLSIKRITV